MQTVQGLWTFLFFPQGEIGEPGQKGSKGDKGEQVQATCAHRRC